MIERIWDIYLPGIFLISYLFLCAGVVSGMNASTKNNPPLIIGFLLVFIGLPILGPFFLGLEGAKRL